MKRPALASPLPCLSMALAWVLAAPSGWAGGKIIHVAGGNRDATGIPAAEAKLREPFGTEFDSSGAMWIVEMASGNRLFRAGADGLLEHVAGQPEAGFSGDGGPALEARFNGPHNLAVLPDGRVVLSDTWNGRLRVVDPASRKVDSLPGYAVPLEEARRSGPYCVSLEPSGESLLIADLRQILRLDLASGAQSVVAGNG